MAITTVSEATAVNTLIRCVAELLRGQDPDVVTPKAAEAAAELAGGAYKKLLAGFSPERARELITQAAASRPAPRQADVPAPAAPAVQPGLFPRADPTPALFDASDSAGE